MTTTITIELTSTNPDATWEDVLRCISAALSPADKDMRLKDVIAYPGNTGNEYRFQSGMDYNGVSGTAVIHVDPELPTGYGAVVKAGLSSTLYTRVGDDEWVSSASGTSHSDNSIKGFLRHGATVLFEGVQQ